MNLCSSTILDYAYTYHKELNPTKANSNTMQATTQIGTNTIKKSLVRERCLVREDSSSGEDMDEVEELLSQTKEGLLDLQAVGRKLA